MKTTGLDAGDQVDLPEVRLGERADRRREGGGVAQQRGDVTEHHPGWG